MSLAARALEVACAARRDYLPHTATMIASLLANSGAARIHLLVGDDVEAADGDAIEAMAERGGGEVEVHRLDGAALGLAGLKSTGTLPMSHWYRVLLPHLLDGERVLYLDGDLIVLEPLAELFATDLDGNLIAAVTNPFPDNMTAEGLCRALGVEARDYFNSGVMVLDLAALRDGDFPRRVLEFARTNAEVLFLPEQDAMNAVLADRRLPLHPRWNSMHGLRRHRWSASLFGADELADAIERPAIRHFEGTGPNKPWHPDAAAEDRALYESYRRRTPWPDPAVRLPAR